MITLDSLNSLTKQAFTQELNGIFEHSPWIPEKCFDARPFSSWQSLYTHLCRVVDDATPEQQLELIRAHPDLAGKLAVANQLTDHSTAEQSSAALDQLSPARFEAMQTMNADYQAKFGFPFIICVKDHTQDSIFSNFSERLHNTADTEKTAALAQIQRIAWHRLQATVTA